MEFEPSCDPKDYNFSLYGAGKGKDPAALLEFGKVFYGGHLSQKPTKHYGLCGCMYLKFLNAEKGNWPPTQP